MRKVGWSERMRWLIGTAVIVVCFAILLLGNYPDATRELAGIAALLVIDRLLR